MKKIFLSLTLLVCFFSSSAYCNDSKGKFVFVKGKVFLVSYKKKPQMVAKGTSFETLDVISTKPNALAVLELEDGSKIKVDPDTKIKIEKLITKHPESSKGGARFLLQTGNILVQAFRKITGLKPEDYQIQIKYRKTILGLRGTEFLAGIDQETEDLWTSVKSGVVEALNFEDDDHEIIKSGETIVIEKGQKLTLPTKFEWAKKINWDMDIKKTLQVSNFRKFRRERIKELHKLRNIIKKRDQKKFKNRRLQTKKKDKKT